MSRGSSRLATIPYSHIVKATKNSFTDPGDSPKLLSSKVKFDLDQKLDKKLNKRNKSLSHKLYTLATKTRKKIVRRLSMKSKKKKQLTLSPDTAGKRKQVLKRKRTLRRKKR
tara:strand:+ start:1435 stop:1770 length:336 start_codon:yes stop_codon:yes gene_type:complete